MILFEPLDGTKYTRFINDLIKTEQEEYLRKSQILPHIHDTAVFICIEDDFSVKDKIRVSFLMNHAFHNEDSEEMKKNFEYIKKRVQTFYTFSKKF